MGAFINSEKNAARKKEIERELADYIASPHPIQIEGRLPRHIPDALLVIAAYDDATVIVRRQVGNKGTIRNVIVRPARHPLKSQVREALVKSLRKPSVLSVTLLPQQLAPNFYTETPQKPKI